jgi:hypothetical protein
MRRRVITGVAAAALMMLAACAPSSPPLTPSPPPTGGQNQAAEPPGQRVDLRVVYLIHGDGDYAYHDSSGKALRADQEAFRQAVEVAERAPNAEVFIFHQGPAPTRMFGSVPGGTFSHYRFGRLLRRQRYVHASDPRDFAVEAGLFQAHADDFSQPRRVLAYFGHEIPPRDRPGYSASDPGRNFSIARFSQGLSLWARSTDGSAQPFDLVVLSTCYGGSPMMMAALAPLTRFVVASPAYLHLSYLDTRALARFEADSSASPAGEDTRRLAETIAAQSFDQLARRTQTEITVGVYDLEQARVFLESNAVKTKREAPKGSGDSGSGSWRDCGDDPAFNTAAASSGVTLRYRPPRFGPGKDITARSAWQCAQ